MSTKMPISKFVSELEAALNRKDGYIMAATGQNPKKWATTSWWFTQYNGNSAQKKKALYWRENAERVWDCNGLAEGLYKDYTGIDINTRARNNYSQWCDPKGKGDIPTKYRVPGAAVFIYSSSAGYITHVGYLDKPVNSDNPSGDWYVIEARGVMYGVVRTKLSERSWNRWGLMTKYFDYTDAAAKPTESHLGDHTLRNGDEGSEVKELQSALIELGYSCGRWGADGDFGDATELAVKEFQKDHDLEVDGIYGPKSHAAMEKALAANGKPVDNPVKVKIVGGNCYIRDKAGTDGKAVGTAKRDSIFEYAGETADNGWNSIKYKDGVYWVSGKYSKLVEG